MKIQHKITWISSLLFGSVFAITSFFIYQSFIVVSERIFFKDLSRTSSISGMFYLEKDELNKSNYLPIQNAFYQLNPERKISIYDKNTTTVFNTKSLDEINHTILDKIRKEKHYNFTINNVYYDGLFYEDNQGDFVVIVSSENPLIEEQKESLMYILSIVFVIGMLVLIFLNLKLSKFVYKPVRTIIKQVDNIDLNSKRLQLAYPKTKDELEELFEAFNNLLKEINQAYQQQKNFVNHASHELKTPLASIINNLEVTLQRDRTPEDYKENSYKTLQIAQRLEQILKNLLLLSGIQRQVQDKTIVRIDEIIWGIITDLQEKYPHRFDVLINIPPEKSNVLSIKVNETMLYMALFNLMENAAKFSKQQVSISLDVFKDQLMLTIEDQGIGIPEEDINNLKQPFYRSTNAGTFEGHGLGFSISTIILEAHHIRLLVNSELNKGTSICLTFP